MLIKFGLLALFVVFWTSSGNYIGFFFPSCVYAWHLFYFHFYARYRVFSTWEVLFDSVRDAASLGHTDIISFAASSLDTIDNRLVVREFPYTAFVIIR